MVVMKRILDIFCGCGGMSLGFQNAGFKIVGAFDNWKSAVDVYNKNFTCKACLADVYDLAPEYLDAFSPDVIIGGPPCQDYSSAGKLNESGGRAELTLKFSDLICKIMPVYLGEPMHCWYWCRHNYSFENRALHSII